MSRRVAVITNAGEYVGPPAARALAEAGFDVLCHAEAFADDAARGTYEALNPGQTAAAARSPEELVAEAVNRFGRVDAAVSNDFHDPATCAIDAVGVEDFRATLEALLVAPFRLCRAVVPVMKRQGGGSIVLVTSGGTERYPPHSERPMYCPARAGANTLARNLASDVARFGIQVNAVAPFLVYSPTFFPSEIGPSDPRYAGIVEALVPMGRFGEPAEAGALVEFLASGRCRFLSGQVIAFSGAGA